MPTGRRIKMDKMGDSERFRAMANRHKSDEIPMAIDKESIKHLPIAVVDKEGDRLAVKYGNPGYRGWYCKGVHSLGIEKIAELERRADEGNTPARLFSSLLSTYLADK